MKKEQFASFFLSKINFFTKKIGYEVIVNNLKPNSKRYCSQEAVCINIGSGDWEAEGWLNLDYPTDWYSQAQSSHKIIPYDIRSGRLPFEDNSVDLIYISHVIEHIENKHIANLFAEAYRVLKSGGGMRVSCPDADFLYQVTKAEKKYWTWREEWFNNKNYYNGPTPRNVDFLVREIATPKLIGYTHSTNANDYLDEFMTIPMDSFLEKMTQDLSFRKDYPGDHINYWTFSKTKLYLENAGFKNIIQSKYNASVFEEMRHPEKFDLTYPIMSLFVECIKKNV